MEKPYDIPFNRPCFEGNELAYITEAMKTGKISGNGLFTRKCSTFLEEKFDVPRVLLTTSCTHALEMAALLLDIAPGDEVIVPSFTFVSTANAFALRGARIVFADVRPDTLNLDESLLEFLVTSRTRAIVPVHYAGVGCEMDAITHVAEEYGLTVIEDNAHGLFGTYKGKYLGTFGALSTVSFHETKGFTCGEGGALFLNEPGMVSRAEIIREKGTNRAQFFRGEVDRYTWVDLGSSYVLSDVLAAFLYGQLEYYQRILDNRRRIWDAYYDALEDWASDNSVRLPVVPEHCGQAWHMFYLLFPEPRICDAFIAHLQAHRILSVFHYVPLHLSAMGRRYGGKKGQCPVAESISVRLVRLPFYNDMTAAEQDRIIEAIREFHA